MQWVDEHCWISYFARLVPRTFIGFPDVFIKALPSLSLIIMPIGRNEAFFLVTFRHFICSRLVPPKLYISYDQLSCPYEALCAFTCTHKQKRAMLTLQALEHPALTHCMQRRMHELVTTALCDLLFFNVWQTHSVPIKDSGYMLPW